MTVIPQETPALAAADPTTAGATATGTSVATVPETLPDTVPDGLPTEGVAEGLGVEAADVRVPDVLAGATLPAPEAEPATPPSPDDAFGRAAPEALAILQALLPHRRYVDGEEDMPVSAFPKQLEQIGNFVDNGLPVLFVLPAFPCKSPNPEKVLGHLPDEAERRSLAFLDDLCARMSEVYEPGCQIVICSDGHVFGDLIGVPDEHVDEYGVAITEMIEAHGLTHLRTFAMADVVGTGTFEQKRERLEALHCEPFEDFRARVKADEHLTRLYRGVTRFLVDDTKDWEGSKSALQRECRKRAYGVVQRSAAWGDAVERHFPGSVRLSIHPQPVGHDKLGLRLLDITDMWTTPWHSCLVQYPDGSAELMPHHEAKEIGVVVHRDGVPDHYIGGVVEAP